MAEPSILVDLKLRDLATGQADQIIADLRAKFSQLSIPLPAVTQQVVQQSVKAAQAVQNIGTAATQTRQKLISLVDVFKKPQLFEKYIEQQRKLFGLKGDVEREIGRGPGSVQQFVSVRDVVQEKAAIADLVKQKVHEKVVTEQLNRAVRDELTAKGIRKKLTIEDAAQSKQLFNEFAVQEAERAKLRVALDRAVFQMLPKSEQDVLGKKYGRSTITMDQPFGSFVTAEGISARFKSLISGQVGTLIVFGAAMRGATALVTGFMKANIELEDALARLNTVLQGTARETVADLGRMRNQATLWAATHTQAAKDVVEAQYHLASAGQNAEEIQRNLPAVLSLAYGGFLQTAVAAETAATAYEIFSKQGESMLDIVNKIQRTNEVAQVTVEQYAASFTYLASTADQANISLTEISAAIGTLGTLGLRGSKGGRNLDEALGQILKKQDKLRAMGVEVEDLSGNLKTLGDILAEFRDKLGSRIDVQELKILRDVFGQQGGRAFGLLIENLNLYLENRDKLGESGGAIFEAELKRIDTLSEAWNLFGNRVVDVFTKIGLPEKLKEGLAGAGGPRGQGLVALLIGQNSAEGVRHALDGIDKEFERHGYSLRGRRVVSTRISGLEMMQGAVKSALADKRVFERLRMLGISDSMAAEIDEFRKGVGHTAEEIQAIFLKLAGELERGEKFEKARREIAGIVKIVPEDLRIFDFSDEDVDAIKKDAPEFFRKLQEAIGREIALGAGKWIDESLLDKWNIVGKILRGILDDKKWRPQADEATQKILTYLEDLRIKLISARLSVLKAIKTEEFGERLQIIDKELILETRKNALEYQKAINSIPEGLDKNQKIETKGLLKDILDAENEIARTRAKSAKIDLEMDILYGDKPLAKLKREIAQARVDMLKSIPVERVGLDERLGIINEEMLLSLERNRQRFLEQLKGLGEKIWLNAALFKEARADAEKALTFENIGARNKAIFERDEAIRHDFVRKWEADSRQMQRIQELMLQERGAGEEERRVERNRLLLGRELAGLHANLRMKMILFNEEGKLITPISELFAQETALRKIGVLLRDVDATDLSAETLNKVANAIREIGLAAGFSREDVEVLIDRLLGLDPKIVTTMDIVHGFADALGELSGMMQSVGNAKTWSSIDKGISVAESAINRIDKALDQLHGGKDLLGVLGIAGTVMSVVGFVAGLLDSMSDEQRSALTTEEYKYKPGKNVSPSYGRAQTVNVQVDVNPNFNFLDPSQLTSQRQRDIAFELGDEMVMYFQDGGWLPRR